MLKHEELTQKIIGVFFAVCNDLGAGFLEAVYERAMEIALIVAGFTVAKQVRITVWFRGQQIGEFFADIMVEGQVLLELKAVRALETAHEAQLLNYLRVTEIEVGLLLNFGPKPEFRRELYDNDRKKHIKRINTD